MKKKNARRADPGRGALAPAIAFCRRPETAIGLGLFVVTAAVYSRAILNGYIRGYDDDLYVINNVYVNSGVTLRSLAYTITGVCAANWHPLTILSLILDTQFLGTDAWGHHAVNVVLHAANSVLVFLLFRRMTGATWRSAAVAALFSLHPIHVESVAHIAQRKDVLSAFFGLLSMLSYARYARTQSRRAYVFTAIWLGLGLLAKPMLVTLPVALLLLDVWPLRRVALTDSWGWTFRELVPLVREKLLFFGVALVFCATTLLVHHMEGAVDTLSNRTYSLRLENVLVSYVAYMGKMFWPTGFSALYPLPYLYAAWKWIGAGLLLAAITGFATWRRKTQPYVLVGWLWYLITLTPMIGFVPVGYQAMADRYTYVTLLGLYVGVVWLVGDWLGSRRSSQRAALGLAAAVYSGLVVCTWTELGYWSDPETLWTRAIAVTKDNARAQFLLAVEYAKLSENPNDPNLAKSIEHGLESVRIEPDPEYLVSLGDHYLLAGKSGDAEAAFRRASESDPRYWKPYLRLGSLRVGEGKFDEAESLFGKIEVLDAEAHVAIGNCFLEQNVFDHALSHFQAALKADPRYAGAHYNLARLYDRKGLYDDAIKEFQEAQRLEPILDLKPQIDRIRMKKAVGSRPDTPFSGTVGH